MSTNDSGGMRERKKLATRQALSAAALRLALEHGPQNVRVDDIAEAAVGFVSVYLTPQLESSLLSEKLRSLESSANTYSGRLNNPFDLSERQLNSSVRAASERTSTRVTLLSVRSADPPDTYVISDSNQETDISDVDFSAIADQAVAERKVASGTARSDDGAIGQAAKPLFNGKRVRRVVVFSAPLADVADNVALIRSQILVAGGLGLLLALIASTVVARWISRRVQSRWRRARGACRAATSRRAFPEYDDELGSLSQALDDMQGQLAQLDSARKRFIATASHELRTPLFSLGGFLELLEDEDLDDDTRRAFIRQVRQQTLRLQKLATDLLDLSRLEAGSLELRPEPTDVGCAHPRCGRRVRARDRRTRLAHRAAPGALRRSRPTATPSASPRCCASCSTTR